MFLTTLQQHFYNDRCSEEVLV